MGCMSSSRIALLLFLFQAEDGIRDLVRSRGLGDVYKRQYLMNDVKDAPVDRVHPVKRRRPVAAGELTTTTALVVAAVLAVLAMALAVWILSLIHI